MCVGLCGYMHVKVWRALVMVGGFGIQAFLGCPNLGDPTPAP